jgi:hypothetical protein
MEKQESIQIATALEAYKNETVRVGKRIVWSGGAVVLICFDVTQQGSVPQSFRILGAFDTSNDAASQAVNCLKLYARPSELSRFFAILVDAPENHRSLLKKMAEEGALVQRPLPRGE